MYYVYTYINLNIIFLQFLIFFFYYFDKYFFKYLNCYYYNFYVEIKKLFLIQFLFFFIIQAGILISSFFYFNCYFHNYILLEIRNVISIIISTSFSCSNKLLLVLHQNITNLFVAISLWYYVLCFFFKLWRAEIFIVSVQYQCNYMIIKCFLSFQIIIFFFLDLEQTKFILILIFQITFFSIFFSCEIYRWKNLLRVCINLFQYTRFSKQLY
eukprot:TRINITY_DN4392_c2_g1_i2.p1 TRINITY_DN4392_c2_g1~~TRINITY_DN4392_c2_g1_i2.p1  ORF type:complete len:212 (+),score=-34.65 TRINITY_DN4392_c2_g1_i2:267-902(+)